MKNKLKCASFFAGVGGIDFGFQQAGFETIYANEFDSFAVKTFESNFDIKVDHRDIKLVESESIPEFDILLAGFPLPKVVLLLVQYFKLIQVNINHVQQVFLFQIQREATAKHTIQRVYLLDL
jgi:hypothetical protein